jgi:hypothetical protein
MALENTLEIELLLRSLALGKGGVTDATVVPLSVRVRSQLKLSSRGRAVCLGVGEGLADVGNIHWVTRLEREGFGVLVLLFSKSERGIRGRWREVMWDGKVELVDERGSWDVGEYFESDGVFGESVYKLFDADGD